MNSSLLWKKTKKISLRKANDRDKNNPNYHFSSQMSWNENILPWILVIHCSSRILIHSAQTETSYECLTKSNPTKNQKPEKSQKLKTLLICRHKVVFEFSIVFVLIFQKKIEIESQVNFLSGKWQNFAIKQWFNWKNKYLFGQILKKIKTKLTWALHFASYYWIC